MEAVFFIYIYGLLLIYSLIKIISMKKLTYLVLSLFSTYTFAQEKTKDRLYSIISTLASDEMKGREIGTPENDNAAKYIAKLFEENKLDYCTGNSYLVPFNYKGKTVYNVCGIKKGKSEKTLGFSGHFDHIGTKAGGEDTVFNGADDNASGISTLVGISDYFKTKTPEFSLLFMAFNGEEKELLGSQAIANDPKLDKVFGNLKALFNFEMLATPSEFGKNVVYITGDEYSDMKDLFNKLALNDLKIHPDPYASEQLFYRSDNVSFVKKKIIAHSISTVDMSAVQHYHQLNDDINVVDFTNLSEIMTNFAKTIEKLNPKNFDPKYTEEVNFN